MQTERCEAIQLAMSPLAGLVQQGDGVEWEELAVAAGELEAVALTGLTSSLAQTMARSASPPATWREAGRSACMPLEQMPWMEATSQAGSPSAQD